MDTFSVVAVADAVEQEIARLRAARPHLSSRIQRAENILVGHLSCKGAGQRVIRVRVGDGGHSRRFLVNGSGGAVFTVDPLGWQCSCPDAHRRGKGCKHAMSCWVMARVMGWRASARPALPTSEALAA